jgi:hypothetical protein
MKLNSTFATSFEVMKRFLVLAGFLLSYPALAYVNNGVVQVPPMSPSLVDQAQADPNFFYNAPGALFSVGFDFTPLQFSAINYTNKGNMVGIPGFDFETWPVSIGVVHPAGNFINTPNGANGGVINCSGIFSGGVNGSGNFLLAEDAALSGQLIVKATNIVHSGQINMDASGLVQLSGNNVDLTRGSITMASPSLAFTIDTNGNIIATAVGNAGILDGYWGVGTDTNGIFPAQQFSTFPPVFSPAHQVTTRQFLTGFAQLVLPNAVGYVKQTFIDQSNVLTQVIFVQNTNSAFQMSAYMVSPVFSIPNGGGESAVQWQWVSTNLQTGLGKTNYLYLTDDFGEITNLQLVVDGNAGPNTTEIPINYNLQEGIPYPNPGFLVTPASSPLTVFQGLGLITNSWSSYEALFTPSAQFVGDVAGQDVTNLAGRVEITGDNVLDLTQTRISALAYTLLKATNHFKSSAGAYIQSPNLDLYLRSTNGVLASTNLTLPYIDSLIGSVAVDSTRWHVTDATGVTNWFHVLFVDSQLAPISPVFVETLSLKATNAASPGVDSIVISDILNVTRNLYLDSQSLTITTNGTGAFAPSGQLNLLSTDIYWSSLATPRLQYLTNWGGITTENLANFAGNMVDPFSDRNSATPYQSLINYGGITNQGCFIEARHFDNFGTIYETEFGSIDLISDTACLENGTFNASAAQLGDISISANELTASNHSLLAGGSLILSVTNCIRDGYALANQFGHVYPTNAPVNSVTNGNFWVAGGSFNALVKPQTGDLLATTVSNTAPSYANITTIWAGEDRGASPAGFANDLALGHLVLFGGTNSQFTFTGAGGGNALYVDAIDFLGSVSNYDSSGIPNITISPNMRIYYAQATAGGVPISDKLNGLNGGRFLWVSNYAGIFSATNVFVNGNWYTFNTHLWNAFVTLGMQNSLPGFGTFDNYVTYPPCACETNNVTSVAGPESGSISSLGGKLSSATSDNNMLPFPIAPSVIADSNLLALAQGDYNGLFYETNGVVPGHAGYISASLNSKGRLSGSIKLGANSYNLSGNVSANGALSLSNLKSSAKNSVLLNIGLQLDLGGGGQMTGYVSDVGSNWVAMLLADRATNHVKSKYTFVIPGNDDGGTNSPAGHGIGTLSIVGSGIVQWNATLADGTVIPPQTSARKAISGQGISPIYFAPYSGTGLLMGWLQFTNADDSDFSGQVIWIKPAGAAGNFFRGGFTNDTGVVGSGYKLPATTSTNGMLVLGGGNLSDLVTNVFILKNNFQAKGSNQFNFMISKPTGIFSGNAAGDGRMNAFKGVILQKSGAGFGYFLGTNESGQVWFNPAP